MATISRLININGFCPVDNEEVPIEIEYLCFPSVEDSKKKNLFVKNSNQCYYLKEGKCNLNKSCPIYQNAEVEKYLDR